MMVAPKPLLGSTCTEIGSPDWQFLVGWITSISSRPTAALFTPASIIKRNWACWLKPSKSSKVTSPLCHVPPCTAAGRVRTKAVVPEPPGLVTCRVTLSGTLAAVLASLPKFTYLNFTVALARGTTFCISFTYKRLSLGAVCIA